MGLPPIGLISFLTTCMFPLVYFPSSQGLLIYFLSSYSVTVKPRKVTISLFFYYFSSYFVTVSNQEGNKAGTACCHLHKASNKLKNKTKHLENYPECSLGLLIQAKLLFDFHFQFKLN